MAYNKFITYDGIVALDLTSDTVTIETLAKGVTAHDKRGEPIVGIKESGEVVEEYTGAVIIQVQEEKSIWNGTDLTGTIWNIPSGWNADSSYGHFTVDGEINIDSTGWIMLPGRLAIGYGIYGSEDKTYYAGMTNSITYGDSDAPDESIANTKQFSIKFTGGASMTNMRLITWLRQNGELTSHKLPEYDKTFTKGYTLTISSEYVYNSSESSNEIDIMLTFLDGSYLYIEPWEGGTWTDVVALTCTQYVSFTENGLANYLENGTYFLSTDIIIDKLVYQNCIDENTLVTMADGSAKRLGDIEIGDDVLSIDYNTMTLVSRKVIYSGKNEPEYDNWYVNCYWENVFSDGTIIKQAMNHRFYNLEDELYVYMKDWNTGEHTYKLDGTNPQLISRTLVQGRINYGRITLADSNNYFANGLSTADRRACPNKVVLNAPLQRQ